jgi:3-dehydro-L-gulonate 2-dehydrogenase
MLDLIAAVLSGGRATCQVPAGPDAETALSQVFVAFDLSPDREVAERIADEVIRFTQRPPTGGERVRYPGERTLETRRRSLAEGVIVEPSIWSEVQKL